MKTYRIIVLDVSGSMSSCRDRTHADLIERFQICREVNKEEGGKQQIVVCFISFNNHLNEHLWLESAEKLVDPTLEEMVTNGGTALNDAIMYALAKAEETIKLEDDDAILVEILTDGQELDSVRYKGPAGDHAVKQKIQSLENSKNPRTGQSQWTITYIGAGTKEDVRQAADKYGISHQNVAAYSKSNTGGAYAANKRQSRKFFAARSQGFTNVRNYQSDVDGEIADFSEEEDDLAQEDKKIV